LQQEILSSDEDIFTASQKKATINQYKKEDDSFLEFIVPICISTAPWGVLRLGFSLKLLNSEIANSRKEIRKQHKDMVIRSILTSVVFVVIGIIIVLLMSTRLSKPLIKLTAPEDGMVQISVKDTGIGIAREDYNKVFEEFKQIDSSYSKQYQGTG